MYYWDCVFAIKICCCLVFQEYFHVDCTLHPTAMWRGIGVPYGKPGGFGSFIFLIIVAAGLGFEFDDSIISPVVFNGTDLHLQGRR